jgi:outer membrane protein assembly factor BamB
MADGVMGLDRADGKLLWHVPIKTTYARHATTPVVVDDMVMVASHQVGLIGVKITKTPEGLKAETAWTSKDEAINFSSPVAVGQYLYGLGPNKNLLCVDTKTGAAAWSKESFLPGNAGKSHVGIIVAGPNLMVLNDDGQLALVAADPKAFHEISRVRVCTNNWCNPAYADGKLYLRDVKELLCVELMP